MYNKVSVFKFLAFGLFCVIILTMFMTFYKSITVSSKPVFKKTIVIDAGHGTPDSGAVADSGVVEKDLNLQIAKKLKKIFKKHGANVIMTRKNDNSLSNSKTNNKMQDLKKRKGIATGSGADIFISIHMNHFYDSKYSGAQVFYNNSNEENELLAEYIQESLIKIVDSSNTRKIKTDNSIYILKNIETTAVLVECGFMSNRAETEKLKNKDYQNKIAKAIYSGVIDFFDDKTD